MMTSIATAMIASAPAAHATQASQPVPRGIVAVRADGDVNALITDLEQGISRFQGRAHQATGRRQEGQRWMLAGAES